MSELLLLDGALSQIFGKQKHTRDKIEALRKAVFEISLDANLYPRDRLVLTYRLKNRLTLEEIGNNLGGITKERVRQLENRAGVKVRKYLNQKNINTILSLQVKKDK